MEEYVHKFPLQKKLRVSQPIDKLIDMLSSLRTIEQIINIPLTFHGHFRLH
jgi:cell division FtsZ-interacting protein ZapD